MTMLALKRDQKEFYLTILFVLLSHVLLLYFLVIDTTNIAIQPHKKIVVQTIKLKPSKQVISPQQTASPKTKSIQRSQPKKETTAPPKKTPVKPISKPTPKKEIPKKTPPTQTQKKEVKQPAKNELMQKLLAEAKESLDKIDLKETPSATVKAVGKTPLNEIKLLSSLGDTSSASENSFKASLIQHLQNRLQLPDYGEVELSLTIDRSGKFVEMKILSSQSVLNKNYVLEVLPRLTFTSFGSNFKDKKLISFHITLTNE